MSVCAFHAESRRFDLMDNSGRRRTTASRNHVDTTTLLDAEDNQREDDITEYYGGIANHLSIYTTKVSQQT
jgi:hypothetical protein